MLASTTAAAAGTSTLQASCSKACPRANTINVAKLHDSRCGHRAATQQGSHTHYTPVSAGGQLTACRPNKARMLFNSSSAGKHCKQGGRTANGLSAQKGRHALWQQPSRQTFTADQRKQQRPRGGVGTVPEWLMCTCLGLAAHRKWATSSVQPPVLCRGRCNHHDRRTRAHLPETAGLCQQRPSMVSAS